MPRRKKGRDKPRSSKRRQREPKNLFALNVEAFQKIGDTKPIVSKLDRDELRAHWEQRIQPQPTSRSFGEVVNVKIEKVSLIDFEQEVRRGKQVIRRRRASPMRTIDFYELRHAQHELEKYRQYKGDIYYAERYGAWYITLADLLTRIGPFEAELTARTWAQRYLGRKYFKGEESGA